VGLLGVKHVKANAAEQQASVVSKRPSCFGMDGLLGVRRTHGQAVVKYSVAKNKQPRSFW